MAAPRLARNDVWSAAKTFQTRPERIGPGASWPVARGYSLTQRQTFDPPNQTRHRTNERARGCRAPSGGVIARIPGRSRCDDCAANLTNRIEIVLEFAQ